jgi:hypothetical protein
MKIKVFKIMSLIVILLLGPVCTVRESAQPDEPGGEADVSFAYEETDAPEIQEPAMRPLPLGTIRPAGWLKSQLQIQADGLSGHLDEFWPDVKNSGWFGGDAEAWERAPYWLDGFVPLAYLLDDENMITRVRTYMDLIIKGQDDNGWIGPVEDPSDYDLWAIFLVTKPLLQYYEASGDERVPDVIRNIYRWVDSHIGRRPLKNWGKYRWFEALLGIYQTYERTGEKWLLDLAVKLHSQGFDWIDFFKRWPITEPTEKGDWNYMGHVVNNAMAVKAPGLWWRLTGNPDDRLMVTTMMDKQDRYHGTVVGIFTGDECLAGKNPIQGIELCAVVEYMYSLEVLSSVLGDARFGDRLEKLAFNALPATFKPDMWAHQYDQQVNQVLCSVRDDYPWTTNGPESNIYGLEPNYGCCTANFSQGWPKFASHLWMRTGGEDGLAAVAYAPCELDTVINDVPVTVKVETDYPFRETVDITLNVENPVAFPLKLRIPDWTTEARLVVSGEENLSPSPGNYYEVQREWEGETKISLTFPMQPRGVRGYNNSLAIIRGPLVYSLKIDEEWKRIHEDKPYRELPHGDWEVHPAAPWNYALDVDESDLAGALKFEEHPVEDMPFSPEGAPVSVLIEGIQLEDWELIYGSAGNMPVSPVAAEGEKVKLTLIPYGCTNLRLTQFPTVKR